MKHDGEVIEKVIRRNGVSIAELGRVLNVNRRSIYNWFNQRRLNNDLIIRIGQAINYDFSKDFPNYSLRCNMFSDSASMDPSNPVGMSAETLSYWQNKYIELLEKYNGLLTQQTEVIQVKEAAYAA